MLCIAIDPGKQTGLAFWEDGVHEATHVSYDTALDDVVWDLKSPDQRPDLVVIEDFIITAQTAKKSSSTWKTGKELEFIGVVRWFCRENGVELVVQTPAQAASFSTDTKLYRMGWWTAGLDHSRSASRHLLLALAKRGLVDPSELVE